MIIGPYSLTVVENEDFGPLVFTYYPNDTTSPPFDFTGYTAQMMIRANVDDAAPVLTLTPVLGGVAGTISISLTAVQTKALVAAIPALQAFYDILLTSPGGAHTYFITTSRLTLQRAVTR